MTVLIVDDDEDVRDMVALSVSAEGFAAATASDGKEALDRLRETPKPSLVFLDLRMPRMNGFDVLAAMRRDPELGAVPVVVITGDSTSVPRAIAAGAVECLVKPIELDDLIATVRRFEDRRDRSAA